MEGAGALDGIIQRSRSIRRDRGMSERRLNLSRRSCRDQRSGVEVESQMEESGDGIWTVDLQIR